MVHLKSDSEVEKLRASATLVGQALAEVARHVRPGVSTAALDGVAEAFIEGRGARPAFKGYRVGRLVFPASLCISVNDEVVHGIPSEDRVLEEGDLVTVDCGALLNGYYGDSAYTFAVGDVDPENLQLCRVTYESLHRGIGMAVTGNRIGDVSSAIQEHCEAHGYGVVRDLVGHGIGRQLHEDPQVPNYGRRGQGRKLRDGLTMCLEPMINRGGPDVVTDPDGWTIRTRDGSPSAHYEHMVVVRGGEAEVLSTFAYIEEVIEAPYRQELTHG